MSINVNVSGNPVSIRRGKMFMSDIESFKNKETQRRRRARLDQVKLKKFKTTKKYFKFFKSKFCVINYTNLEKISGD